MQRPAIEIRNLTVAYRVHRYRSSTLKEFVMNKLKGRDENRVFTALDSIQLSIGSGESVAFIGHNGSGKSTLLKCIAGIIRPEGAHVRVEGRIAPMIELGTGFDGELSGRENITLNCTLLGLSSEEIAARMGEIIHFSELADFIDMPLKNYSSGMQARLGFACSTAVDPEVLLVDEVLSVGDSNFSQKCLKRIAELRAKGTTVVLVSHDPGTVERFCDRAIVLDEGRLVFDGDVRTALERHVDIMQLRFQRFLSAGERAEYLRKEKLRYDYFGLTQEERLANYPKVVATGTFLQDGTRSTKVDTTAPFRLEFELTVTDAHLFGNDVTIGFAFNSVSGMRVGGLSNKDLSQPIDVELLKRNGHVRACFDFPRGVPALAAGTYHLIVGVHQEGLTKTVHIEDLGPVTLVDGPERANFDSDIYRFDGVVEGFQIEVIP